MTDMIAPPPASGWRTIGNEFAVQQLRGAVQQGRVAHAYLITGPDRVGKLTLARDLARALCCGEAEGQRPCGSCSACGRIDRGVHPDVRTINVHTPSSKDKEAEDAANRVSISLELIRDLRQDAVIEPYESAYKVFIIEGAHQMTDEATNALLKTLEEPPPSVRLVLTAPAASQLRSTIVSRCHVVQMRAVPRATISAALTERYDASEEDALVLAELSGGNPGWAIAAHADPGIVDNARESVSRITTMLTSDLEPRFRYARDLATLFRRDRAAVMTEMTRWTQVLRDLAYAMHDMAHDGRVPSIHDPQQLQRLSSQLDDGAIAAALAAAESARDALGANALPQLTLEVMMMDTPVLAA